MSEMDALEEDFEEINIEDTTSLRDPDDMPVIPEEKEPSPHHGDTSLHIKQLVSLMQGLPAPVGNDNLHHILQEAKGRILLTGSFLVKACFPNIGNWQPEDVDIFIQESDALGNTKGYELSQALLSSGWAYKRAPAAYWHAADLSTTRSVKYKWGGFLTLNIIWTDCGTKPLRDFIESQFDIDGCSVCYDGDAILYPRTMPLEKFLSRQWTYRLLNREPKNWDDLREDKAGAIKEMLKVWYTRSELRIDKYRKRGFGIDTNDAFIALLRLCQTTEKGMIGLASV